MVLLAYSCSVIFSFLYQFSHKGFLSLRYFYTRSRCDYCAEVIKPYDLLPIISFITLNGRSRCCRQKITNLLLYRWSSVCYSDIPLFDDKYKYSFCTFSNHFSILTYNVSLRYAFNDSRFKTRMHLYHYHMFVFTYLFLEFLIVFTITHTLYLFMYKLIGYGDIIIFNMLALFYRWNSLLFVYLHFYNRRISCDSF